MALLKKLFIITVVKDSLVALEKTYKSLAIQTFQDFTWLVQDGFSTDGTSEWLRALEYPNLLLYSEHDNSIHHAMNLAIRKVSEGHCMFLNAGDAYEAPDVLERIIAALKAGDVDFGYGQYIIGGVPGFPERCLGERIHSHWQVLRGRVPCHQTMVISRDVFEDFGFYDESLGIFSDRDWILGYVMRPEWNRSVYFDFPVVYYDPVGRSYHRFISKWRVYLAMLSKRCNPIEFVVGLAGFARAAAYIMISKQLGRLKGAGSHGR